MNPYASTRFFYRFSILVLLAVFLAGPLFSMSAKAASTKNNEQIAQDFIRTLADKAVSSLTTPGTPQEERIKRFRTLFNEYFAVRGIGKWVLGRYWRQATKQQQEEYLRLFEDLMVVSYVERFSKYSGESLEIIKAMAHKNKKTTTVFAKLTQPNVSSKIRVDWRVTTNDKKIKITDVTVEGISMGSTLKSDFGSIIRGSGNSIEGLIVALREKTSTLRVSSQN